MKTILFIVLVIALLWVLGSLFFEIEDTSNTL